ncbi:MAG: Fic family protein [Trueperaceae bacterium]
MTFNKNLPYNDLPFLPPQTELETKRILKQVVDSSRALAELKGAGDLIPNQTILLNALGLQEAKLSSEIENIVTTNDELYRAFAEETTQYDHATKEVLHYNQALWIGYEAIRKGRPLSTTLFEEIVQTIKLSRFGIRKLPGTKIANSHQEIIYTPPEGEKIIRDLLANLEHFLYAYDDLDPLIKMAVMHYQFEAIHPFPDGNGRTGRIINILYLVETGLLNLPILYLSRYIIQNKNDYYEGLRRVTEEGAWEEWVLYILKAVEKTALQTSEKITAIRRLMEVTGAKIKMELPKVYRKELVELLFRQPYCKIKFLELEGIAARQTAASYLKQLEQISILRSMKRGTELYYLNVPFFELLIK